MSPSGRPRVSDAARKDSGNKKRGERVVLDAQGLSMRFGGVRAVEKVDLQLHQGEIIALIGPNGAGKTTFFNCVTGIYEPTHGSVKIHNKSSDSYVDITGNPAHQVLLHGVARTFQNIRLFQNMTALENVMVGATAASIPLFWCYFQTKATRQAEELIRHKSYEILKKIGIERHVNVLASSLPYGEQRRLEIARALATEPSILLLDEPAAGMNPQETRELVQLIRALRKNEELSILLIEHDMSLVMDISEHIYVMDYGELIATGNPKEISNNELVIKAYLGD